MKGSTFLRFLIIFFTLNYTTSGLANTSIYYIDMDYLLNNSLAGKSIIKQLDKISKKNLSNFKKTEEDLKKNEIKIISQKNILNKNQYENEIKLFQEKVSKYKLNRTNSMENLSLMRTRAQSNLINLLTPILEIYSKKNSISIIIPKKNIIIAKSELDLTDTILEILDSKVKTLKLK